MQQINGLVKPLIRSLLLLLKYIIYLLLCSAKLNESVHRVYDIDKSYTPIYVEHNKAQFILIGKINNP